MMCLSCAWIIVGWGRLLLFNREDVAHLWTQKLTWIHSMCILISFDTFQVNQVKTDIDNAFNLLSCSCPEDIQHRKGFIKIQMFDNLKMSSMPTQIKFIHFDKNDTLRYGNMVLITSLPTKNVCLRGLILLFLTTKLGVVVTYS